MAAGSGHYKFSSANLDSMGQLGSRELAETNNIWSDVIRQIQILFPNGEIDAGLAQVLEDRNDQYTKRVNEYADGLAGQNIATNNINNVGVEGGAAMRKAAML